MTWLVLGANGQLGRSLAEILKARGIDHVLWSSKELDIRSSQNCNIQIPQLSPNVVINAAAWTDVDGAEENQEGAYAVNAFGAINLAKASKAINAIFAQVSTDYVFSGNTEEPWSENSPLDPISVYGASKAAGEVGVLLNYPEKSYIFRTAWLYSPWGKNFAKTMAKKALNGQDEVTVVNDQFGQPTNAHDLANQIVDTIIEELPFGIYHATNSGQASWFDFAQEVFLICGTSVSRVIPVSSANFVRTARRPKYSVLSHDAWGKRGISGKDIPAMPDWRISLKTAMPAIISGISKE